MDTAFAPAVRLEQIRQAHSQGLRVFGLVEPVGPEHSDEEIADSMLTLREEIHTGLVGVMARVPVVGSPLYGYGAVDVRHLAAITAVFILAMADRFEGVEVVCSHPPARRFCGPGRMQSLSRWARFLGIRLLP